MRLKIINSKNVRLLYVIKTIYVEGKEKTVTVEKLGRASDIKERLNGSDPIEWAKIYVKELNEKELNANKDISVKFSTSKCIEKDKQLFFNGGYLFLQKIYHELGLNKICSEISKKYKFDFDLNSVLSRLVYSRIIYPSSKLAMYELSKKFIEKPNFELQHIYRSLDFIAKESDFIQASLYSNSLKITKRNSGVLYYDCTNFFYEIEEADIDGLRQYGFSKEHRPNPIVQMGLFMDGDGIPLAFSINKGNTNEQTTLKPLEEKILSDFGLSKFVVCTDAGLASISNRKFNSQGKRAFITTQSIKKLKGYLREWALNPGGWHLAGDTKIYDISKLYEIINEMTPEEAAKLKNKTFFKERWINDDGLEQKLIVTFSFKYRDYQRNIRNSQIERAQKVIDSNPKSIGKPKQNDFKRFIKKTTCTKDGEIAKENFFDIDSEVIENEMIFDGFYGVCTNLDDTASEIIKVNHRRWEIEECFRIMKSEFKARPVYLSRDDRIIAHFTTCFVSLLIYRFLEKKLNYNFTCHEIINGLKEINFLEIQGEGYIPTYTRNTFTDELHRAFGFNTDSQISTLKKMKNIFLETKK
jgi:transposase